MMVVDFNDNNNNNLDNSTKRQLIDEMGRWIGWDEWMDDFYRWLHQPNDDDDDDNDDDDDDDDEDLLMMRVVIVISSILPTLCLSSWKTV